MNFYKKSIALLTIFVALTNVIFALPFNAKLSQDEITKLINGDVLIKSINNEKNVCLNDGTSPLGDYLIAEIKALKPKYLAEVIQVKPYEGNENLPEVLSEILNNVEDYAGIPYWSVRHQKYFDLYSSAKIVSTSSQNGATNMKVELDMAPFGIVKQNIDIVKTNDCYLYVSTNTNNLKYHDEISCVGVEKMKMCIYLFKDGNNWILYGIGGVNAPKIPLFTERIETSFINRIKTFCNFIFTKI